MFCSGAAALSLELLASRVLTPYFGVSLYIWSGILSITLISLAAGYWLGGRLTHSDGMSSSSLKYYFGLLPGIASICLTLVCVVYPFLFWKLATLHLIAGSFIASSLMLMIPLVAIAAMNPLLVALVGTVPSVKRGDAGAGNVFFISTVGSVFGVNVTAFILIPGTSNFKSLLCVAIFLGIFPGLLSVLEKKLKPVFRRRLQASFLTSMIFCTLVFLLSDRILSRHQAVVHNNSTFELLEEVPSFHTDVKVLKKVTKFDDGSSQVFYYYTTFGLVQSRVLENGSSASAFPYCLEAIGRGVHDRPRDLLILGLAGGTLPMRLQDPGMKLDIVDIEPEASRLASQYFYFSHPRAEIYTMDARVFVRETQNTYDLVFFDLFGMESAPDHLMTKEFFQDTLRLLNPGGRLVMNTIENPQPKRNSPHYCLLNTLLEVYAKLMVFHDGTPGVKNVFIAASPDENLEYNVPSLVNIPNPIHSILSKTIEADKKVRWDLVRQSLIFTDDFNQYAVLKSDDLLIRRRENIRSLPRMVFSN